MKLRPSLSLAGAARARGAARDVGAAHDGGEAALARDQDDDAARPARGAPRDAGGEGARARVAARAQGAARGRRGGRGQGRAPRGGRAPETPRMTYSAYLKALKIRETLERERKAAAKDGKSDEKRRESARRAGAKVKAATVDFDAERERAADERKASRQEFVESFRSGAKMRENQAKIRQAASRQP